jgi:hypothetical protein
MASGTRSDLRKVPSFPGFWLGMSKRSHQESLYLPTYTSVIIVSNYASKGRRYVQSSMDTYLQHMICFLPRPVCKPEAIKNFKAAALQPISLAVEYLRAAFVDYPSIDPASCHPCSQHQALAVSNEL